MPDIICTLDINNATVTFEIIHYVNHLIQPTLFYMTNVFNPKCKKCLAGKCHLTSFKSFIDYIIGFKTPLFFFYSIDYDFSLVSYNVNYRGKGTKV